MNDIKRDIDMTDGVDDPIFKKIKWKRKTERTYKSTVLRQLQRRHNIIHDM